MVRTLGEANPLDGTGDAAQELILAVTWGNIKLVRMLLAGEPSLVGARN